MSGQARDAATVARLNDEANALLNRAEAAEAKAAVLEAALYSIATEPSDRGVTPNFRAYARDVLDAYRG
jgi:hypothetical protein